MKKFNSQQIINVLQDTFKDIDPKIAEAKKDLDIIIETEKNFYKDLEAETIANRIKIVKEFQSNQITQPELKERMYLLGQEHDKKKSEMTNVNGIMLMKEFESKHLTHYSVKGFEKEIRISSDPTKYEEVFSFTKDCDEDIFKIVFFLNADSLTLDITVQDINQDVLNIMVYQKPEKENLCIGLVNLEYKDILIECKMCEQSKQFFDSITETDLLNLDSEENEEMFSILFDSKLDLKSDSLYANFKKGMNEFGNVIEELSNKKKNTFKI